MPAHRLLGTILYQLGQFVAAAAHLEEAVGRYDPAQHPEHARRYGQDQGVTALGNSGIVRWLRGYPDQGLERSRASVALARRLGHPFSLGTALVYAAGFH